MGAKAKLKRAYGLAEAKAKLSELVEKAQTQGAQPITRRGRVAAYIVSDQEWKRRTRTRGTLYDFFRNSPLVGSGVDLERHPERRRSAKA